MSAPPLHPNCGCSPPTPSLGEFVGGPLDGKTAPYWAPYVRIPMRPRPAAPWEPHRMEFNAGVYKREPDGDYHWQGEIGVIP